jgi:quercetin dioxygenase-like cupin family protein
VDFRWSGVPLTPYKPMPSLYRDVTRQTLLGEGAGEGALAFLTRYFEIAPGGYSTLERHQHPHTVVVLRGRGEVTLDGQSHPIAAHDCVYVAPDTPHQFRASAGEVLGFLCVVDRERDRPEVLGGKGTAETP